MRWRPVGSRNILWIFSSPALNISTPEKQQRKLLMWQMFAFVQAREINVKQKKSEIGDMLKIILSGTGERMCT